MTESDCSSGQVCEHNICVDVRMGRRLDDRTGCMTESDCSSGQVCEHNICVDVRMGRRLDDRTGCMTKSDCSSSQVCEHNICVDVLMGRRLDDRTGCMTKSDCSSGCCVHNICVLGPVCVFRRLAMLTSLPLNGCPSSIPAPGSACSQRGQQCKFPRKYCTGGGFEYAVCKASGEWGIAC